MSYPFLSKLSAAAIEAKAIAEGLTEDQVLRRIVDDWANSQLGMANELSKLFDGTEITKEVTASIAKVPRRRKKIFDLSGGRCHYCGCELELRGSWHIDHKIPKALFGSDEETNLVASCPPCNLRKGDKTDREFFAEMGRA